MNTSEVTLVTGAAQGIGRAIAKHLSSMNHQVILFDLDLPGLGDTKAQIERSGGKAEFYKVDITDDADVSRHVEAATERFGPIINLVNNAGISCAGSILELDRAQFERIYGVNVWGTINMSRHVLPHMIGSGRGRIVNVASWLGKLAKPNSAAYSSSKAAVISLTQSMSTDFASHGILVNAVCPGIIANTSMRKRADKLAIDRGAPTAVDRIDTIPLGRMGEPEDVAHMVAFLMSEQASYMTGQAFNITGGMWKH